MARTRDSDRASLESAISSITTPFVLIIDALDNAAEQGRASNCLPHCAYMFPIRGPIALAGRSAAQIPLGRFRAEGRVLEIGRDDLAMTAGEAAEILAAEGADVASATIHDVWNRTEGWPVALYLAARVRGKPHG